MQIGIFFFRFSFFFPQYTQLYVCSTYICTPKIQWWAEAERKEKKSLESFKSTPRIADDAGAAGHVAKFSWVRHLAAGMASGELIKSQPFARWAALTLRSYLLLCSLVYKNMGGLLQQKAYSQQSVLSSLPNGLVA